MAIHDQYYLFACLYIQRTGMCQKLIEHYLDVRFRGFLGLGNIRLTTSRIVTRKRTILQRRRGSCIKLNNLLSELLHGVLTRISKIDRSQSLGLKNLDIRSLERISYFTLTFIV